MHEIVLNINFFGDFQRIKQNKVMQKTIHIPNSITLISFSLFCEFSASQVMTSNISFHTKITFFIEN